MSRLIESIRLKDGKISRLDLHQQRMNISFRDIFGMDNSWNLREQITKQTLPTTGLHKIRVCYDLTELVIQCTPYTIKPVSSLRLINSDIAYACKFEDRQELNDLFAQRGSADDILIVKQGRITDTSYANIVFWDDQKWVTPSSILLPGTMRQFLLQSGIIVEQEIRPSDLPAFNRFKLINSMLDWDGPEVDILNIH